MIEELNVCTGVYHHTTAYGHCPKCGEQWKHRFRDRVPADELKKTPMLNSKLQALKALEDASQNLRVAHAFSGEVEGQEQDLSGPIRDMIYGLNTALESLTEIIKENYE